MIFLGSLLLLACLQLPFCFYGISNPYAGVVAEERAYLKRRWRARRFKQPFKSYENRVYDWMKRFNGDFFPNMKYLKRY